MLKKGQPGIQIYQTPLSWLQSQVLCLLCHIGKAHGILRKALEKASCFSLRGRGYERQSCAPTRESTCVYRSATSVLVFAPVQAHPSCCQCPTLPGLALLFCCLPGGSRERRAARARGPAAIACDICGSPSCCPAQVARSRCRRGCETQTFRVAAMPPWLQSRRAGAASEHLKWRRGLAGEQGEARSSVCVSFTERLLLVMGLSLPKVSHVPGFSKNPEKVGEGFLGSPCRRSDYSVLSSSEAACLGICLLL